MPPLSLDVSTVDLSQESRLRDLVFTVGLGADALDPSLDDESLIRVAAVLRRAAQGLEELLLDEGDPGASVDGSSS